MTMHASDECRERALCAPASYNQAGQAGTYSTQTQQHTDMAFWRLLRSYDKERIESRIERVRRILGPAEQYDGDHEFALVRLDAGFRRWHAERDLTTNDSIETLDAFGIAYGQYIADTYDLRWVAISGERHAHALLGGEDILVYPQNIATANHERFDIADDMFARIFELAHKPAAQMASIMAPTPNPPWWAFWRR